MKVSKFAKGAVLSLACAGLVMPQQTFAAAPVSVSQQFQIADVAVSGGVLKGKVVNAQGQVLSAAVVKVSQGNKIVSSTVSNEQGEFAISNLNNGVYQLASGETQAAVRVWDAQIAPPAAKQNVLLVQGNASALRAQSGFLTSPTGIVIIGGAIIAGTTVAIVEGLDDEDDSPITP